MLLNILSGTIEHNTDCPFRSNCEVAKHKQCGHMGKRHNHDFYCNVARNHEIMFYSNIRVS